MRRPRPTNNTDEQATLPRHPPYAVILSGAGTSRSEVPAESKDPYPHTSVPHPDRAPVWQKRFYDFNVRTEQKQIEKLRYMHRNPVKRGLVEKPEQWEWSSFRSYLSGETGLVRVNFQEWPMEIKGSPAATFGEGKGETVPLVQIGGSGAAFVRTSQERPD